VKSSVVPKQKSLLSRVPILRASFDSPHKFFSSIKYLSELLKQTTRNSQKAIMKNLMDMINNGGKDEGGMEDMLEEGMGGMEGMEEQMMAAATMAGTEGGEGGMPGFGDGEDIEYPSERVKQAIKMGEANEDTQQSQKAMIKIFMDMMRKTNGDEGEGGVGGMEMTAMAGTEGGEGGMLGSGDGEDIKYRSELLKQAIKMEEANAQKAMIKNLMDMMKNGGNGEGGIEEMLKGVEAMEGFDDEGMEGMEEMMAAMAEIVEGGEGGIPGFGDGEDISPEQFKASFKMMKAIFKSGASMTSTNKPGNSFCGGRCNKVSNEMMPISLTFDSTDGSEDEKRTRKKKQDKNQIILIQNFRPSSYSTIKFLTYLHFLYFPICAETRHEAAGQGDGVHEKNLEAGQGGGLHE